MGNQIKLFLASFAGKRPKYEDNEFNRQLVDVVLGNPQRRSFAKTLKGIKPLNEERLYILSTLREAKTGETIRLKKGGTLHRTTPERPKFDLSATAELSFDDWNKILAGAKLETFDEGAVILTEGTSNGFLYRVKDGEVQVQKETSTGEQKPITTLGSGRVFGESAVMGTVGNPTASVVALCESTIFW